MNTIPLNDPSNPSATPKNTFLNLNSGRTAQDKPFEPLQIADPVARCVNRHAQVKAQDYLFTPYLNRPDPLPARVSQEANHVGIYNYQFGPRDLRVKVGSTVVWR